jgi:hypothetical protein
MTNPAPFELVIGLDRSDAKADLYPINPITLQKFREAFVLCRAKDDTQDAQYLARLLLTHHAELTPWQPEDQATRLLQHLVAHRRAVVAGPKLPVTA